MAHYMAIRVKCSIMIINAPFGEGDVSLSNSAHLSPFTIHFSPFTFHNSQFTIHNSPFTLLNDQALGGGGVGAAEGDEVGAGGVLGK